MRPAHPPLAHRLANDARELLWVLSRPAEIEPSAPLAGPPALFVPGQRVLEIARQRRADVALLLVHVEDLYEVDALFGREAAHHAAQLFMTQLSCIAGHSGVAARPSKRTFALLKPRRTADELLAEVHARMGKACSVEFTWDGEDIVLVPHVQVRDVDDDESIECCYSKLRRAIASNEFLERYRLDQSRRENERHSTVMSLPPEFAGQQKRPERPSLAPG